MVVGFVSGFLSSGRALNRSPRVCSRANGRTVLMTTAHGHGEAEAPARQADPDRRPGSHKGFVEEMRFVAMKLHTKDQAKEGMQEESALPINEWRPAKEDYLQFLVDSKCVYEYIEGKIASSDDETLARFKNSGLERTEALERDIVWFTNQGFSVPEPTKAAEKYVAYLEKLIADRPNAFLCHWYNYYFAHTAGGRMIGRMMSSMLFDGFEFDFYLWDRDVKEILSEVRVTIDDVAKDWPRDVKDDCLKETQLAFSYSGTVLGALAKAG